MKRTKILLTAFLMLILILIVTLVYNKRNASESSINLKSSEYKLVTKNAGSLKISVDPRIELLSAVQLDSNYDRLTQFEFNYRNDMENYFKNYKNQNAVRTFKKLENSGYSYDAPPTSMLYLTNPPKLEQNIDFDKYIISRTGNEKKLTAFIQQLREFSINSNFKDFYDKNLPLYKSLVNHVYTNIKDMDLTKALDDYYGMKVNSYNIILAPMLHNGGYGPRIQGENGLYDVYALIGPANTVDGQNGEIIPEFSIDTIHYIVWHEFSHSFVNPTTEKYEEEINKYGNLYTKIKTQMEAQAYPEWTIYVNEHIVRAVTTRLTYLYLGQDAGDKAMASEKSHGFDYIEALCESLKIYEENRDSYPTFESYYPELIKVFQKLSEQD